MAAREYENNRKGKSVVINRFEDRESIIAGLADMLTEKEVREGVPKQEVTEVLRAKKFRQN